jgi:hypothetical protein
LTINIFLILLTKNDQFLLKRYFQNGCTEKRVTKRYFRRNYFKEKLKWEEGSWQKTTFGDIFQPF